ncbi:MAG TPA: two-component regulator propeller domain-containing protein, partial [Flavitalea sp.]|nr:two-component regulator propeller domain-containing protein [Flavitalea sp.]
MLKQLSAIMLVFFIRQGLGQMPPVPIHSERVAPLQARQFMFTHFNSMQGLASNYVNNIIQDRKGFMWLSTANGLQRYDGNKFTTYKSQPGNNLSLPDDNIAFVYADKNDNLWVGTGNNKIGIFNPQNSTYQNVSIRSASITDSYIPKKIIETDNGELLLAITSIGVLKYNQKKSAFEYNPSYLPLPDKWHFTDLCEDHITKRFWLAADSGISVFDPVSRHLNYRGHNIDNDPLIKKYGDLLHVGNIYSDDRNRFLVVSWRPRYPTPTLYYHDSRTNESRVHDLSSELGIAYHEILGSMRQSNGKLWIYGLPFMMEYGLGGKPLNLLKNAFKDDHSNRFEKINDMYEDKQHNIWVSTNNGIFYFNPDAQMFNSYDLVRPDGKGLIYGITQSVCQINNGNILVGCWGAGLYAYDKNFSPVALPPDLDSIKDKYSTWSILQHSVTKMVWMCLQGGGLIMYDPARDKHKTVFPDIFKGRTIRVMVEDKAGDLWFGTQGGLIVKWDQKKGEKDYRDGFSVITQTGLVHKLFVAKDGMIWVATLSHGLLKIDPALGKVVDTFNKKGKPDEVLWSDVVTDIAQRNDSILLVSAGALNMINLRTRKTVHISSEDGLPGNNINCIVRDRNGIFWLGSYNGICRFNIDIGTFTTYNRKDGITYDAFNPGDAHTLPDGRLAFTNNQNFVVFDPLKMVQSEIPPDALITDVRIGNEPVSIDSLFKLKKLNLPYNKNSIVIEFSALNYLKQQKLHYHYQLEGLEKEMQEADEHAQAVYSYLPPGNYTFNVMAENADGITSKNITSFEIEIRSPFWQSWWFYAVLLLALASILYWAERERIKKSLALQQVRTQIAGNLHKELDTTLNNISLLSEMAKIKADKDIARSKEYIDQINEKSRKMIIVMDDMFWSIDPANDNMEMTLLRMNEFVSAMRHRHSANIEMVVDEKVSTINLDMKARYEFYVIFRRVLRTVASNSMANQILINIDYDKSALSLKIQSNGVYGPPDSLF